MSETELVESFLTCYQLLVSLFEGQIAKPMRRSHNCDYSTVVECVFDLIIMAAPSTNSLRNQLNFTQIIFFGSACTNYIKNFTIIFLCDLHQSRSTLFSKKF